METVIQRTAPAARVLPLRRRLDEELVESLRESIIAKLTLSSSKAPTEASNRDWFVAAALTARDRIVYHWAESRSRMRVENRKRVYYLSLEFLIGRLLGEVMNNLELTEPFKAALGDLGVDYDRMFSAEPDAALGNGGLGVLQRVTWKVWRRWLSRRSVTASGTTMASSAR